MYCDYEFCIYEKDGSCTIDNISIDGWGRCTECISIYLTREELDEKKAGPLARFAAETDD